MREVTAKRTGGETARIIKGDKRPEKESVRYVRGDVEYDACNRLIRRSGQRETTVPMRSRNQHPRIDHSYLRPCEAVLSASLL